MAAEGDPVAEKSTYQIVDSVSVSPPPKKKKKMKGKEECEMLEKVLLALQIQVQKRTGDSSSNVKQICFR